MTETTQWVARLGPQARQRGRPRAFSAFLLQRDFFFQTRGFSSQTHKISVLGLLYWNITRTQHNIWSKTQDWLSINHPLNYHNLPSLITHNPTTIKGLEHIPFKELQLNTWISFDILQQFGLIQQKSQITKNRFMEILVRFGLLLLLIGNSNSQSLRSDWITMSREATTKSSRRSNG